MAKKLPSINHNEFADVIRDKQAAEALIRQHDKAAREARKALSVADALLRDAMGKHAVVQCGDKVLAYVTGKPVPGALTLHDGGKIPLDTVTGVQIGKGTVIPADLVKTWYGGRDGSDKIEISEAV